LRISFRFHSKRAAVIAVWLACCLAASMPASAQDDVIGRARAAAAAGRRTEGLALLEQHLTTSPRDVDARLVYGLMLSWDGRYDEARAQLEAVLAQTPDYLDARVALMHVEWWSGRAGAARELARVVLSRDAGNTEARLVQQRLDAQSTPWTASAWVTRDIFDKDRDPWTETAITVGWQAPVGSMLVRGSQANRFDLQDRQIELEFYPTLRAGTYAFAGIGIGVDERLYPEHRFAFDLYQSLGRGFEVSGGFRRLGFDDPTHIYVGTLVKYVGNWMYTGKVFLVPDSTTSNSWSYHGNVRRYFGAASASFLEGGYMHGLSRDEPRGRGDLVRVDADSVRGQADIALNSRLHLSMTAGTSRQERALRDPLWQTTLGAGFSARF
jgi:YaiO family outer membrane protein